MAEIHEHVGVLGSAGTPSLLINNKFEQLIIEHTVYIFLHLNIKFCQKMIISS